MTPGTELSRAEALIVAQIGSAITAEPNVSSALEGNVAALRDWLSKVTDYRIRAIRLVALDQHYTNVRRIGLDELGGFMDHPELFLHGAESLFQVLLGVDPA